MCSCHCTCGAPADGEEPVGKALIEKTDRSETADVILQNYPEVGDRIVANVLLKIGRKDLVM